VTHLSLRLKVDGNALAANWRWLAQQSGAAACGAAVKADGYGLGATKTVGRLAEAGCRDFFVATWAEAAALAPWPEELSLSVLHGVGPDDLAAALASPARPVLNTATQVARWRDAAAGRACDIMVDTGMSRLGLSPDALSSDLLEGLDVVTLMSHLACADEPGHPLNEIQRQRFEAIVRAVPARRYSLANSGGICLGSNYAFDLTRPGLAIYGGIPVPEDATQAATILQVASIEAQIIQVREVKGGDSVGYGATYVAPQDRRIAILNIGYADGYLRALGGQGFASAGGERFPVVGRVSMDLTAVDLGPSDSSGPGEGDWLEVDYRLPQLAAASGLSQYELLTMLGDRHQRIWA
jgi:alanine racemase